MSSAKTARWLDLIAFLLQHRYPVVREELFRKVRGYLDDPDAATERDRESARRKFERDKDELRTLGVEIETLDVPSPAGDEPNKAYRLRPGGFYLPYFELHPSQGPVERPYRELRRIPLSRAELRTLDRATKRLAERTEFPLAGAAASLRRKLSFDLPLAEAEVERVLAEPLPPESHTALAALQEATAERRAVRCTYYSIGRDASSEREIEPWALFFDRSTWYCVGRARDRDALRVFRVDRMRDVQPLAGTGQTFAVPADFDVRRYLGRQPWDLSNDPPQRVRVRFGFPQSRWVLNEGRGTPVDPLLDDGSAILDFEVRERGAFLRWLLTFRKQAQILEPRDVADELEDMRRQVARLYER
jgi:predicted DNA-binding transcriptional regulator YafY